MTKWSVERRFPRYDIHLPCAYAAGASDSASSGIGWTHDVSEGGACVELPQRYPPRTTLHLCLQTKRGAIEVHTEVVWSETPALPGGIIHGVSFTLIVPDQLQALRTLLQSPGPAGDCGTRLHLDLAITCHRTRNGDPPLQGRTGNIGREGLLLFLPAALSPETELEITLHTPAEPLRIPGKIVWTRGSGISTPGGLIAHGFQFTSLRWCTPLILASLLGKPVRDQQRSLALAEIIASR